MEDRQVPVMGDPLGEALHFLRMSGTFYCRSEMSAPWGLRLPPMRECLSFHVVTEGRCTLTVKGATVELGVGEIAVVPHGEGHALMSGKGVATPMLETLNEVMVSERYSLLRHGGGGAMTKLLCGAVRFDNPAARQLVQRLPKILHVEAAADPQAEWIASTLRLIAAEASSLQPGGEAVITRLADILVIQAIRAWMRRDPEAQTGWLGALQDRQIGRALTAVHRDPAREWSVASLAQEAAMSRSAFAARFTTLVGETAMAYVARWRMHLAHESLRDDRLALGELAGRMGYQSEAAFSRAFKRYNGLSPGAVRKQSAHAR